jgi:hypothetical protein
MGWFHRETLIERLARESRFLCTGREGDFHQVRQDDGAPLRYVNIRCRDDKPFVVFYVNFPVRFPLAAITPDLTLGLLSRNREVYFGRWCIDVVGSCELLLYLHHTAIKAGLTAGTFKTICLEMIGERESLHVELRDQVARLHQVVRPPGQPLIRHDATGRKLADGKGGNIVWLGD